MKASLWTSFPPVTVPHPNYSPPKIVLLTVTNSFTQLPPTSPLHPHPPSLHFPDAPQKSHSSLRPLPLIWPCPVNTSSPLPGSFAPQNRFKRNHHSTSSNTLFILALPLQHFFPPLLLPTHSFLLSKDTPRAHPNQASPCRLLSLPNDASTNPQM